MGGGFLSHKFSSAQMVRNGCGLMAVSLEMSKETDGSVRYLELNLEVFS